MTAARSLMTTDDQPTVIDADHLGRMTLGDRRLEREILELFVRQTALMLERIAGAQPPSAAAAAHTLKGSARGIGAWRVARAAELLEQAAGGEGGDAGDAGDRPDLAEAIAELKAASLEASAAIGSRLTQLFAEARRDR
ncbi:MAG TPA: Hpt domain-containing protein [Xanthobacteraceae bacterium]|nr:Hpt domain-containing protein [Xanthobacteraceae bacterium]